MTDEISPTLDLDSYTVRRTIQIDAPLEKVWAAISEPAGLRGWFSNELVLDSAEPGASGTVTFASGTSFPLRVEDIEPMTTIAYRWSTDRAHPSAVVDDEHSTLFRFTLVPNDAGTELTVVETGFETLTDPAEGLRGNDDGWVRGLGNLVAYLGTH